jgi:hypothetical protein
VAGLVGFLHVIGLEGLSLHGVASDRWGWRLTLWISIFLHIW